MRTISSRRTSRTRRTCAAVLTALGLATVACGGSVTATPSTTAVPLDDAGHTAPGDDVVAVPDPLPPGAPGSPIRSTPFDAAEFDVGAGGARILYHSTDASGEDIAVSAVVFVPEGSPPAGGWPVMAWAHGTTGVADRCAPSRTEHMGGYADYLGDLVGEGFVVVATDYEGLGTPGPHPYLDKGAEARGVIDSVTAARQALASEAIETTPEWVVVGHSQGGQAAIATAEVAGRAPVADTTLVGAVAIAPASQLALLPDVIRGTEYQGYLAFAGAGILAADPEVRETDLFGPAALAESDALETGCWDEVMAAYRDVPPDDLGAQTPEGQAAVDRFLAANEPGTAPLGVPLLLLQGGADDTVPPVATEVLHTTLCDQGEVVSQQVYPGLGHDEVLDPSRPDLVSWVATRLAGGAVAGCT